MILTNGYTTVRSTKINVALRNGCHTYLIISPGEKCGKGASKDNVSVTGGAANCNAHLQNREGKELNSSWLLTSFEKCFKQLC